MEHTWKIIAAIMAVGAFLWAGFSASNFYLAGQSRIDDQFKQQNERIAKLEGQIRLFSAAPTITRQGSGNSFRTPDTSSGTYADDPVRNPLIATCIDLIKRTASAKENKNFTAETALDSLLRDYGCPDLLKRLPAN